MKTSIMGWLSRFPAWIGSLGPYVAIELILPGGSLIALLLWLHQRKHHDLT
jgi:hypothetical protein